MGFVVGDEVVYVSHLGLLPGLRLLDLDILCGLVVVLRLEHGQSPVEFPIFYVLLREQRVV